MKYFLLIIGLLVGAASAQIPGPYPSNREIFKMKSFWIPTAVHLSGDLFDAEITHAGLAHHRCIEGNPNLYGHPSRGQLYLNNLIEFGAITGFRFLLKKGKVPFVSEGMGLASGAFHFEGGAQWPLYCW